MWQAWQSFAMSLAIVLTVMLVVLITWRHEREAEEDEELPDETIGNSEYFH